MSAPASPAPSQREAAKTDAWMPKADDRGHFNIRIVRDGTWLHEGTPIRRASLVKLFASVLHLDNDGQYWLVTPVEKGRIDVDVAPLLITAIEIDDEGDEGDDDDARSTQRVRVATSTGEHCTIDADHPLSMVVAGAGRQRGEAERLPVVTVRDGLTGLFNRASYYALMDLVIEGPGPEHALGVWSMGRFFALESPTPDGSGAP